MFPLPSLWASLDMFENNFGMTEITFERFTKMIWNMPFISTFIFPWSKLTQSCRENWTLKVMFLLGQFFLFHSNQPSRRRKFWLPYQTDLTILLLHDILTTALCPLEVAHESPDGNANLQCCGQFLGKKTHKNTNVLQNCLFLFLTIHFYLLNVQVSSLENGKERNGTLRLDQGCRKSKAIFQR